MRGRYCESIKRQFLITFIVEQLASESPFALEETPPPPAPPLQKSNEVKSYYGVTSHLSSSQRALGDMISGNPSPNPPPRYFNIHYGLQTLQQRHDVSFGLGTNYLPLMFDVVMQLKWNKKDSKLDDVDVDALITRETYDTTVRELTDFFKYQSKLRISKLLEGHSMRDVWLIDIDAAENRKKQIELFATYVYDYVLAQAKLIDGDITMFDERVFRCFLVHDGMVNDAFDKFKSEGLDCVSLKSFQQQFFEAFQGHRNTHQLTVDAENNLSSLGIAVRIPLYYFAACAVGVVIGIDVLGIGVQFLATVVSLSFVFSKVMNELMDGLSLVYSVCPFDVGDMVIIGTSKKSTVVNIGIYSVQLETTNEETWYWCTSTISEMTIQNCTRSKPVWDVFYLWVDMGWTKKMTEQLNREFTKFANSDPATFKPGVTYFVLSNLSGGAGTKCEPLKVQLKCIVGYAWNSSVIRRLNNGRSRAVTKFSTFWRRWGFRTRASKGFIFKDKMEPTMWET
ncbi:hypothetical protein TrVE_jg9261 [Triparma verrucosa]|uniref:Mechanosensitive ion channel MscS domain-containing protein n=1 Tax=Triparma verrucosa TaxID=1606542 RepID=A0A9W7BRJ8_9STRA|nr:hypothetical protein TrVE_jg9261 [Triparma verrucosa]